MSSPVVFSLTAAQCRALRFLAEGKAGEAPERPLRQLRLRGLVSHSGGWDLTPAGEAAALLVVRLSEASPVSGGSGGNAEMPTAGRVSAPGRAPLGLIVKSSDESDDKGKEFKHGRPVLSRLAQALMAKGGFMQESSWDVIDHLTPGEWDLVVAHNAQGDVLDQAQRAGKTGIRSLLAELRTRARVD